MEQALGIGRASQAFALSLMVFDDIQGVSERMLQKKLFIALVVYHLESYGISAFFTGNGTFDIFTYFFLFLLYSSYAFCFSPTSGKLPWQEICFPP